MVFLGYIHNQIIRRIDEKSDLVLNCDPVVLADYQKDAEVFNNLYRELKAMKK